MSSKYFSKVYIHLKDGELLKSETRIDDFPLASVEHLYQYYMKNYKSFISPLETAILLEGNYNYVSVLDGELNGYTYLKNYGIDEFIK